MGPCETLDRVSGTAVRRVLTGRSVLRPKIVHPKPLAHKPSPPFFASAANYTCLHQAGMSWVQIRISTGTCSSGMSTERRSMLVRRPV